MNTADTAIVAGAGPGLGVALCNEFSEKQWHVAALRRNISEEPQHRNVLPVHCDLTSESSVDQAFKHVEHALGVPSVMIYNAGYLVLKPFLDTTADLFDQAWRVNCLGAYHCVQRALPRMLSAKRGTLIFLGATGSYRGGARSAAFASAKFALRGLAQSLAREFNPKGVHVVHVVIDGLIWGEPTRKRFPEATREACISPEAIAKTCAMLVEQEPSAWTHELDIRPYTERF